MSNKIAQDLSIIVAQALSLKKAVEAVIVSDDKTSELQNLFDLYQDFQKNVNALESTLLKFEESILETPDLYPATSLSNIQNPSEAVIPEIEIDQTLCPTCSGRYKISAIGNHVENA